MNDLVADLDHDPMLVQADEAPVAPVMVPCVTPVAGRQLPPPDEIYHILRLIAQELLAKEVVTQRALPKSMRHGISRSPQWLHQNRVDEDLDGSVQNVAALMICIAHRLLWPMPLKHQGQRLPPHSKPKIIQAKLNLLWTGKWCELVQATLLDPEGEVVQEERVPRPVGLLSPSQELVKLVERSTRQGRLAVAWRQLWSHGKMGLNSECAAKLEQKMQGPALPVAPTLLGLVTDKLMQHVCRTTRPGKAADALGWTQQIWSELYGMVTSQCCLRRFVEDFGRVGCQSIS